MSFVLKRASKWDFGIGWTKGLGVILAKRAVGATAEVPMEVWEEIEQERVRTGLTQDLAQNLLHLEVKHAFFGKFAEDFSALFAVGLLSQF